MKVVIGVDLYNHTITGDSSMTLCGARMDAHHVPHILVANSSGGVSQERLIPTTTKDVDYGKESNER